MSYQPFKRIINNCKKHTVGKSETTRCFGFAVHFLKGCVRFSSGTNLARSPASQPGSQPASKHRTAATSEDGKARSPHTEIEIER